MIDITGESLLKFRTERKMSRNAFAQSLGLTPGAMWRIEAKNNFKPGEREKITAALTELFDNNETLPEWPIPALSSPPQATNVATLSVTVPVPTSSPQDDLTDVPSLVDEPTSFVWPGQDIEVPPLPEPLVEGFLELSPYQLFLQDGIRRYSNSEIQTFKRCRRKWYLAHYLRLQPKVESAVGARAIGDRIHRALRWHYEADLTKRVNVQEALEHIIKADYIALKKFYAPELIPLGVETQFRKEADLERVMIAGYLEWIAQEGCDAEYDIIGSEQYLEADLPFAEEIIGIPIKIIARLDARLRRKDDGVRFFMDHKTVGNFEVPMRTLNINEQMLMYILIEHLQENDCTPIEGAIYNMIRKVKRTAAAKPPFYKRVEVRHNTIEINNFQERLLGTISEIERLRAQLDASASHRSVAYPTPSQDCTWSCPFLPIDSLMDDGSNWDGMAKAFYKVDDPTSYYVKGSAIPAV